MNKYSIVWVSIGLPYTFPAKRTWSRPQRKTWTPQWGLDISFPKSLCTRQLWVVQKLLVWWPSTGGSLIKISSWWIRWDPVAQRFCSGTSWGHLSYPALSPPISIAQALISRFISTLCYNLASNSASGLFSSTLHPHQKSHARNTCYAILSRP